MYMRTGPVIVAGSIGLTVGSVTTVEGPTQSPGTETVVGTDRLVVTTLSQKPLN